ncbi:MAG TPA: UbiX family flavin prenyltransferase [Ruminiclostridium sp.]|nr:UbiX family flavin prenyltransferase [Ruminiclostridium sp.]
MNIVVGITGASGVVYGIRLLEVLIKEPHVTTHLVMSSYAIKNISLETGYKTEEVMKLANFVYQNDDLAARISSGSFITDAAIIVPCSMKTLGSVANGVCDTLISRTADVAIKEGRPLILCPRETPLSPIHLENMLKLARLGVKIIPPMPAFYNKPGTIEDILNHHVMKICDILGIKNEAARRWE